jgi:DNA-binding MarR family transcriptional regulator
VELANRVAALGLARRFPDAEDHRRVLVQLTDEGRQVIAQLAEAHQSRLELLAEQLRISPEFLGNLSQEFGDFLTDPGE